MLAVLQGRDGRLGVHVVGRAVVKEVNTRIRDQRRPAGVIAFVPESSGGFGHPLLGPAGNGDQPRLRGRGPKDVGDRAVGVAVGFGHEGVPQQADPDCVLIGSGADLRKAVMAHVLVILSPGQRWVPRVGADKAVGGHARCPATAAGYKGSSLARSPARANASGSEGANVTSKHDRGVTSRPPSVRPWVAISEVWRPIATGIDHWISRS